jgi:hypothetical protein
MQCSFEFFYAANIERNATEIIAHSWPRSPRRVFSLKSARTLGSWFECQSGHWCVHRLSLCLQFCVGRSIAMGRSPVEGALPNVYKVLPEVRFELDQDRGRNP